MLVAAVSVWCRGWPPANSWPDPKLAKLADCQLQLVTHPSKLFRSSQFMVLLIILRRAAAVATASLQRVRYGLVGSFMDLLGVVTEIELRRNKEVELRPNQQTHGPGLPGTVMGLLCRRWAERGGLCLRVACASSLFKFKPQHGKCR